MMNISIIDEDMKEVNNITEIDRIDILSILKLKPTKLRIRNYYLSGVEYNKILEYQAETRIENCYINYNDNSFYKENKEKENIFIKKISRFEIMDI